MIHIKIHRHKPKLFDKLILMKAIQCTIRLECNTKHIKMDVTGLYILDTIIFLFSNDDWCIIQTVFPRIEYIF